MAPMWKVYLLLVAVILVSHITTVTSQASCNPGDVRLQNGSSSYSGRVELCVMGTWSQICDSSWSLRDAEVTCRQLNLSVINVQAYGKSLYGSSTNPIAFTDFQCIGNETNLINCAKSTAPNCTFDNTAGVDCQKGVPTICEQVGFTSCCNNDLNTCTNTSNNTQPKCHCDQDCHKYNDCCDGIDTTCPPREAEPVCTDNEIKLVGGRTQVEGRLELCVSGQWSTVCNQQWSAQDAAVVCRQLQLDPTGSVTSFYGQGNMSILVSDFQCTGNEGTLAACNHTNTSIDCGHQQDVGINCTTCLHGSIVVHGGSEPRSGQVELCWMGGWVTICENDWNNETANVVCRQLGYSGFENMILAGSSFGNPRYHSEAIELRCNGSEVNVTDCPASINTFNTSCANAEFAGIQCHDIGPCEQAGLINCCIRKCETGSGCYCNYACLIFGDCCVDFERVCHAQTCTNGDVRLSHGHGHTDGILQLCINAQMGLVCGTNWSTEEARVLCRSIGLPYTGAWPTSSFSFSGNTSLGIPVVSGDFNCTGDENSLLDCAFSSTPSCGVDNAVGVVCESACSDGDLRLVNGSSSNEGRVEVCINGEWGTVCDEQWTTRDAEVICRQLSLTKLDAEALGNAYFGQGISNRPIFFTDSQCTGLEDNITDCHNSQNTSMCMHSMNAGVKCAGPVGPCQMLSLTRNFTGCCRKATQATSNCQTKSPNNNKCYCDRDCYKFKDCCDDINILCPAEAECNNTDSARLVDGPTPLHGRVEVCVDERWSTVCDDNWDDADATVVCKQLTSNFHSVKAFNGSIFSNGSGPIRIGGFQCNQSTPQIRILDCNHTRSPDCSHKQDAGAECVVFTDCKTLRQLNNFTGCCIPEDETGFGCAIKEGNEMCYCDAMCQIFHDCCDDIDDICPDLNSASSMSSSHTAVATAISTTQLLTGLVPSSSTTSQNNSTVFQSFSSLETLSLLVTSSDFTVESSTQYLTISVKVSTPFPSASPSVLTSTFSLTIITSSVLMPNSTEAVNTVTDSAQLAATTSSISLNTTNLPHSHMIPFNTITDSTQLTSISSSILSNPPQSHSSTAVMMSLTTVLSSHFVASATTTAQNTAGSSYSAAVTMSPTNTPLNHSSIALANTVEVTLAMYTAQQFSTAVTEQFKNITASAINEYCDQNEQMCVPDNNRKRRSSTDFVNKDGIVITTTTNTASGLRIILYAELINGGVLTKDALETAIQAAIQDGLYSGILGEVNVPTASSLPLYLILTSSISGTIVAAIAITVIILGICICCRRSRKKNKKVPVQRTNNITSQTGTHTSTYTFAEGPPPCFDYNEEPKFTKMQGLPEYFDYTERLETTV